MEKAKSVKVKMFGIAKDITGQNYVELPVNSSGAIQISDLKAEIIKNYPEFQKLSSLAVAVNRQYAKDTVEVHVGDEVALIPPVSGG